MSDLISMFDELVNPTHQTLLPVSGKRGGPTVFQGFRVEDTPDGTVLVMTQQIEDSRTERRFKLTPTGPV